MRLCGIDSSTSATGISLFEDKEYVEYKLISMDKKKYPTQWDRLNPMIIEIIKVLDEYQPDIVYQENSWKGRNIDTLKCLTNILGATRGWALSKGKEYYQLMPTQWRSALDLNKYQAERPELKNIAQEYVKEKYGIIVPSDDVSDCICVGLAGIKYYYG